MKRASWIFAIAILGIFSCEEEEFVTQRSHPFVESMDVTQIDETGATVEFEVLKDGNAAIQEYGVEYAPSTDFRPGNNPEFVKIAKSGAPASSLISVRLSYDLVKGMDYVVRPFVFSGGTMVYGENLVFTSLGVNAPVIKEVSNNELYQYNIITIKGDFFNSVLAENQLAISGLEQSYQVDILSATNTELEILVNLRDASFINFNEKYDLVVTSAGKRTVVQDVFTVALPKIQQLSQTKAYVGQSITIQLSHPAPLDRLEFRLYEESFGGYNIAPEQIVPGNLSLNLHNMRPGKYKLQLLANGYLHEHQEEFEILNSWELFQEDLPLRDGVGWGTALVGDKMLIWKSSTGEFQDFYSLSLGSNNLTPLPAKPNNPYYRGSHLMLSVSDRYLYFGLGGLSFGQTLKDFSRFDTQTNSWQKLADYPFENSWVEKSFVYQGKIYVILYNQSNFAVYDINLGTWSLSSFSVPEDLKEQLYVEGSEDGVFYVPNGEYVNIMRYIPGFEPEKYSEHEFSYHFGTVLIKIYGREMYFFNGPDGYSRMNMDSKELRSLQTLLGNSAFSATPWMTSKGMMMVFPKNSNHSTEIKYTSVYRLVAEF